METNNSLSIEEKYKLTATPQKFYDNLMGFLGRTFTEEEMNKYDIVRFYYDVNQWKVGEKHCGLLNFLLEHSKYSPSFSMWLEKVGDNAYTLSFEDLLVDIARNIAVITSNITNSRLQLEDCRHMKNKECKDTIIKTSADKYCKVKSNVYKEMSEFFEKEIVAYNDWQVISEQDIKGYYNCKKISSKVCLYMIDKFNECADKGHTFMVVKQKIDTKKMRDKVEEYDHNIRYYERIVAENERALKVMKALMVLYVKGLDKQKEWVEK